MTDQATYKPKHRAHRFEYHQIHERTTRAKCSEGTVRSGCFDTFCPKHEPANYSACAAKHGADITDGFW